MAAFKVIDASGFSRCDFFLEAATDRVILNEINTIPGMTAMSGFPRLWAASGVDGKALVGEIVRLGSSVTSGSPGSRWRADRSRSRPARPRRSPACCARYSAESVRTGCVVRSTQSLSGGIIAR